MMKSIVITGNAWKDKARALVRLKEQLEAQGCRVRLLSAPKAENCISFLRQLQDEVACVSEALSSVDADSAVLLLPTGLMDAEVLFGTDCFDGIAGTERTQLRDRCDAVFCASEDDSPYTRAWVGATHLRIIPPNLNADAQAEALLKQVLFFLGLPQPLEIEHKYLIRFPDIARWPDHVPHAPAAMEQIYLTGAQNASLRIRNRSGICTYTEKRQISSLRREEVERRISEEEYHRLAQMADPTRRTIRKTRWCFVWRGQYFEMDVFPFWRDRALLEIELTDESEAVELPGFLSIVREVTRESAYKNTMLARREFDPTTMPLDI